ncbi:MAG: helix-turn-helix transcriptional regulator [Smithella sp.]|nr:helix-turn-helix transcriptional regulator [Smithella sp.]
MQAVVRAPHINVVISGQGIKSVVQELKKRFSGAQVKYVADNVDPWIDEPMTKADEQETVNPFTTAWFRETVKGITPGDRLDAERFKHSMTQAQLAELTGIAQHQISEIENGKRSIGKSRAKKFAEAFKVDYRLFL